MKSDSTAGQHFHILPQFTLSIGFREKACAGFVGAARHV